MIGVLHTNMRSCIYIKLNIPMPLSTPMLFITLNEYLVLKPYLPGEHGTGFEALHVTAVDGVHAISLDFFGYGAG